MFLGVTWAASTSVDGEGNHAEQLVVIRRPRRSGRRNSPRAEPVEGAHRPARSRDRAGGRSRRVSRLVVRSRVLPILCRVGHRVSGPDLVDAGRAGVPVPVPAAGTVGVGRAGGVVSRGARADARRHRAERAGGNEARSPDREPRLFSGSRRPARELGRGTMPGPRSGFGGRAGEDPAVVELSRARLRRRPPHLYSGPLVPAARCGGADGPRREPRRGQPLQHRGAAGRRHDRARGGSDGDGRAPRVRDQRRQPVLAEQPRRALGARPDDSAGRPRRRTAAARRVRDGPVRHPGGDGLLHRCVRRAFGDVHRRRHRPAVRRSPGARVPLSRLYQARAASGSGRRGHRRPAGNRGARTGVSDHEHSGRPAGVRRDLRRRPEPSRRWGPDGHLPDRRGRLLPGRARRSERRAGGGVPAVHHRRAHRSGALGHVRQAGARYDRQRHRRGVPGGPRRR